MSTMPRLCRSASRRKARIVSAVAAVVLSSVALTACGSTKAFTTGTPATGPAAGAGVTASAPVQSLTVKTIAGKSLTVPTGAPVVLFFFTASCGSCYAEGQTLATAIGRAGPGAQVIAVDLDPSEPDQAITPFLTAVGNPPFAVVRDDGALLRRFNVDALGTTVVLDGAGTQVFRGVDPTPDEAAKALTAAA